MKCNWCRQELALSPIDNYYLCNNQGCQQYLVFVAEAQLGVVDKLEAKIAELNRVIDAMSLRIGELEVELLATIEK